MSLPLDPVYAILDGTVLASRGIALSTAAEALLDGGLRLLQIRWKETWTRSTYDEAVRIAAMCEKAGAKLVVNDRADIARLLQVGIHVGQDDLPPSAARTIAGSDCLLGFSTHNESQFRGGLKEPADYLALGPIYGTSSKERADPVVGISELARLRSLSDKPVVAIGGITLERALEAWHAGADSVAIIGDLYPAGCTATSIRNRASEWAGAAANEYRSR